MQHKGLLVLLSFGCIKTVHAKGLSSPVRVSPPLPIGLSSFGASLEGANSSKASLYVGGPSVSVMSGAVRLRLEATYTENLRNMDFAVVIDGRHVHTVDRAAIIAGKATVALAGLSRGHHIVAAYMTDHVARVAAAPLSIWLDSPLPSSACVGVSLATLQRPFVGTYYGTIGVPDWSYAMNQSSYLGQPDGYVLSVEEMLRSQGNLSFVDVTHKYAANVTRPGPHSYNGLTVGWIQSTPALSAWYPYRKRETEAFGILPDSPRIPESLETQAAELNTCGVDYALGDGTNLSGWPSTDAQASADVRQMRPFEVIMEEWSELREEGLETPQFGVWGRANNGDGPIWRQYLSRMYNNETYRQQGLLPMPPGGTKRLFMLVGAQPADVNASLVSLIESNGGLDDITTVEMWVDGGRFPDSSYFGHGMWAFESPCVVTNASGGLEFTSFLRPDVRCNHTLTLNSTLGNQWCISHGLGWNNIPFNSPGKRAGLYVQKQFEDVFAGQAAGVNVDNIFTPSFNEFAIGALNFSTYFSLNNPYLGSMGGGDPSRVHSGGPIEADAQGMFVDGFGDARARAFEPSVFDQGAALELYASCIRVMMLNALWGAEAPDGLGIDGSLSPPCNVAGEVCCAYHAEQFVSPTWSLEAHDAVTGNVVDTLVSSDKEEVALLLGELVNNISWTAVCYPWEGQPYVIPGGKPNFCGSGPSAKSDYTAVRGPFLVWDNVTASAGIANATSLYRCVNSTAASGPLHLLSTDTLCEGLGHVDTLVGYLATWRTSEMPRALRRCRNANVGVWYHAVDGPCAPQDTDQGLLGFVSA